MLLASFTNQLLLCCFVWICFAWHDDSDKRVNQPLEPKCFEVADWNVLTCHYLFNFPRCSSCRRPRLIDSPQIPNNSLMFIQQLVIQDFEVIVRAITHRIRPPETDKQGMTRIQIISAGMEGMLSVTLVNVNSAAAWLAHVLQIKLTTSCPDNVTFRSFIFTVTETKSIRPSTHPRS